MWQAWRNEDSAVRKFTCSIYILLIVMASKFYCTIGGETRDTLSQGQSISGSQKIVSQGGIFELGFFVKGGSRAYLGIWYKDFGKEIIVWVANREAPVLETSPKPKLEVSQDGNLVLLHKSAKIWSTDLVSLPNSVEAVLLDNGNFVLRDSSNRSSVSWQSFDHPTDTWLPGGKLGFDEQTHRPRPLISWKNSEDPSPGMFSVMVFFDTPKLYNLTWNASVGYADSGIWNGRVFSSVPEMSDTSRFNVKTKENEETYYTYSTSSNDALSRLVIDVSGQFKQFKNFRGNLEWEPTSIQPRKQSEVFGLCGAFGIFNESHSSSCSCLQGFIPYSSENAVKLNDWSDGCKRKTNLQCENSTSAEGEKDGFAKVPGVKLPYNATIIPVPTAKKCKSSCLEICSCTAYAYHEDTCSVWYGTFLDTRVLGNDEIKTDLYLKLAGSELPDVPDSGKRKIWVVITAVVVPTVALVSAGYLGYHWRRHIKRKRGKDISKDLLLYDFEYSGLATDDDKMNSNGLVEERGKDFDLPLFSYASVSAATNDFSHENKLGQGGFGPVYKGKSLKGQELGVKRLSKRSGQGLQEFRNEITLIAKLQHRNLVRLLGCCIEQDENILIYEYMPNKSLDFYLSDPNKKVMLDWGTRVRIIEGIAQGLLYLHEHSRLRIIHRDLKPSNILLDSKMNLKISDFGMARIFGGNDTQANTNRIVGTYGYMAPEYALDGIFSIKSDVFSFGVLSLEIVSGKKNTGFYHSDSLNLLRHAWELWSHGRAMDFIDPAVGFPNTSAVLKYINIGLLCVQEYPNDRPTTSSIISMLSNDVIPLIKPKQPAILTSHYVINTESTSRTENVSANGMTISTIAPR